MLRELLGPRIRQARMEAGLSGTQLARLIGKSQPYISDLERGQRTPSLHTLQAIAAALGKPTSYFLQTAVVETAATQETPESSSPPEPRQGRFLLAAGYLSEPDAARRLAQLMAEEGIQSFVFKAPHDVDRDQLALFLQDLLNNTLDRYERTRRASRRFLRYEDFEEVRQPQRFDLDDFQ